MFGVIWERHVFGSSYNQNSSEIDCYNTFPGNHWTNYFWGGRGSNLMQIYGNLDGFPLNAWYYAMTPCFCSTFFEFFGPLWQSNHRCVSRSWEIEIVVTWPDDNGVNFESTETLHFFKLWVKKFHPSMVCKCRTLTGIWWKILWRKLIEWIFSYAVFLSQSTFLSTEVLFLWSSVKFKGMKHKLLPTSYTLESNMKRKQHLVEKENYLPNLHIFWFGFNPENGYKDGDPVSTNNKISWGTNKVYLKTNHFYFSLFGQVAFQGRTYSGTENWVDDVLSFTRLGYVGSFPGEFPHLRTWQNLWNFRGVIFLFLVSCCLFQNQPWRCGWNLGWFFVCLKLFVVMLNLLNILSMLFVVMINLSC